MTPTRTTDSLATSEAERVAARVREEILDGVRAPGSKLVERDLAAELGVSRVPVRDALKTLIAEGLVTPRPRTWAVVREFTAQDVDDLVQLRTALEELTFRLVARRGDPAVIARLRATVEAERAAAAAGDGVAARRSAADFHEVATRLAGNSMLKEVWDTLGARMRWLLGRHDDLGAVAGEHEALLAAVQRGDEDGAAALVAEHLEHSRAAQRRFADGRPGA